MASCNCGRRHIRKNRRTGLVQCCGCIERRRDIAGNLLPPFCFACQRPHHFSPEVGAKMCFGAEYYVPEDAPVKPRFYAEGIRP